MNLLQLPDKFESYISLKPTYPQLYIIQTNIPQWFSLLCKLSSYSPPFPIQVHLDAEANYTIHTFPQESAKCGDKIKAYISCFHLQLNPSFPFFRDI